MSRIHDYILGEEEEEKSIISDASEFEDSDIERRYSNLDPSLLGSFSNVLSRFKKTEDGPEIGYGNVKRITHYSKSQLFFAASSYAKLLDMFKYSDKYWLENSEKFYKFLCDSRLEISQRNLNSMSILSISYEKSKDFEDTRTLLRNFRYSKYWVVNNICRDLNLSHFTNLMGCDYYNSGDEDIKLGCIKD